MDIREKIKQQLNHLRNYEDLDYPGLRTLKIIEDLVDQLNDKIVEKELQEQKPQKTAEEILTKYSDGSYTQFEGYENILMAMEEYASQFQQPKITDELGLDNSWPTKDVLAKLIWASEYLLNEMSYDGDNYEEISICVKRGKEILRTISNTKKITDEEIEKWADKWELNDKVFEDTIMPFFKIGLIEGAKANRDNEIKE